METHEHFYEIERLYDYRMTKEVSAVLASTFIRDPLFKYLLPGEAYRSTVLPILMRALIEMSMPDGHAYCISQPVSSVGLLQPPNRRSLPESRIVVAILKYGLRFRLNSIKRMLRVLSEFEQHRPHVKHYYLMTLGVAPSMQGKGIGSSFLRFVRQLADQRSLPVHLETTNPKNIHFYRVSGYELVERFQCDYGQGPETYIMRRRAKLK